MRNKTIATPNVLCRMVKDAKIRAQKNCKNKFRLMVSRDFINVFYEANDIRPILIEGMFYDIDETLEGICCYCVDIWAK